MAKYCVTSKRTHEVMTFSPPSSLSVEEKTETPTVTLTYFGAVCHVCFNKVKIGTSKLCHLTIKNPNDYKVEVAVKRFPFAKGFSINLQQFSVDAEEEKTVDLTWIPSEEGCFREIMHLQVSSGCQKQIILLGTAVLPPKKKQKSSFRREKLALMTKAKKDCTQLASLNENKVSVCHNEVKKTFDLPQEETKNILKDGSRRQENCENEKPYDMDDPVANTFAKKDAEHPLPATPIRRQTYVFDTNDTPKITLKDSRQILKDITHGIKRVTPNTPNICTSLQRRNMRLNRHRVNILSTRRLRTNLLKKVHSQNNITNSPNIRRETFVKFTCNDNLNDSLECHNDEFNDSLDIPFTADSHLRNNDNSVSIDVSILPSSMDACRNNSYNQMSRESFFLTQNSQEQSLNNFETALDIKVPNESGIKVLQEIETPNPSHLSRDERDNSNVGNFLSREAIQDRINNLQHYIDEIITPQASTQPEHISHANSKATLPKSLHAPKNLPSSITLIQQNGKICSSTQVKERKFEESYTHNIAKDLFPGYSSSICNTTLNDSDFSFLRGKSVENSRHCSTGIDSKVPPPTITSDQFSHASTLSQDSSVIKNQMAINASEVVRDYQLNKGVEQKNTVSTTFTISPGSECKKPHSGERANAIKRICPKSKLMNNKNELKIRHCSRKTEQYSKEDDGNCKETNGQYSKICKQSRVIARRQFKLAQPKLTLIKPVYPASTCVRHPNPFAARNMYYDEKWMAKQEFGFTRWLNFVLTPPQYLSTDDNVKVDTGKFFLESLNDAMANLAPTKEDMSFKTYTALRHLNKLRRASCIMYQSESVAHVITRLETEIENNKLCVRKDKALHADIGIKKFILNLLLCYNPLWLRIGLETIFGELIQAQSNNDILSLSRFIIHRLLNNPDLAAKYAHPNVPHLYKPGYEEQIKKFTLKKFLLLVYFLDNAKLARLIDHDPCLFCKNAKYKSSRDLLLIFSREYLSGEGDITRHLRYLGYIVSHTQTALEEFEYAVTNLAIDLRCGLRLARVIELTLKHWTLSSKLRVPTISRLQKIHNVEVCFEALKTSGYDIVSDVTPRDIVDGHRERTLKLLWQLIFKTQVEVILNKEKLNEEIDYFLKNLKVKHDLAALRGCNSQNQKDPSANIALNAKSIYPDLDMLQLLLKWCQCICSYYGLIVENFTVSFCDGRAFCYIIHHYHPNLLPLDAINQKTTQTFWLQNVMDDEDIDDSLRELSSFTCQNNNYKNEILEELLNNERSNLRLVFDKIHELGGIPITSQPNYICNTIPDEKVVIILLAYLNCRLMDLSQEIRAARIIQLAWRRRKLCQQIKQIEVENKAANVIQKAVKQFLLWQRQLKLEKATLLAQTLWRRYKAKQLVKNLLQERTRLYQEKMATIIQKIYRGYRARNIAAKRRHDIILLQALARRQLIMQRYHKIRNAAILIQNYFRAVCLGRKKRSEYIHFRSNVILLQSYIRRWLAQSKYKAMQKIVVFLQSHIRMWLKRSYYLKIRSSSIIIQQHLRSTIEARKKRLEYLQLKNATIKIQSWYKAIIERRNFLRIKQSTLIIQTSVRRYLVQKKYMSTRMSIIKLQRKWKATILMKQDRQHYLLYHSKVILLQSIIRRNIARKAWLKTRLAVIILQAAFRKWNAQQKYHRMKYATILIQRKWKAVMLGKEDRINYITTLKAVITIQSYFRSYVCKKKYLQKKNAVIKIQSLIRMILVKKYFVLLKHAVDIVEKARSAQILCRNKRKQFIEMKKSAILIQSTYRRYIIRSKYREKKVAIVKLQAAVRSWIMQLKYKRLKNATLSLQKHYRSLMLTRNQRQCYLELKKTVIFVQSMYRSKKVRQNFIETKKATLVIQCAFRCWSERRKYKCIYTAVIRIQRGFRTYQLGKQERNNFIKLKLAAVTIQSVFRGMKCRKEFKKARAAYVIQSHFKQYRIRKWYLKMRLSCIRIQSFVRMHQQRKRYLLLRQVTINMQQRFRAKLKMHSERQQFVALRDASIKLQSFTRAAIQRKKYLVMRKCVIIIQSHFRQYVIRQQYVNLRASCIIIQSSARAMMQKKRYLLMKKSCIRIQSCWRRYSCRKYFLELQFAALVIQRCYRALLQVRNEKQHYQLLRKSTIVLQSWIRMKLVNQCFRQKRKACILIQSYFRVHLCQKHYIQLRKSSLIVQQRYRALLQGRKDRYRYQILRNSSIKVQSVVRGWLVRKRILLYRQAAIKIQAWYKQKKASIKYKRIYSSILIIQQHVRAFLSGKKDRLKYIQMKKAVMIIEMAYCNYKARQKNKINSIIKVQSFVRMFIAHKRYLQLRQSCMKLQAVYYMKQERIHYLKLRKATVTLQNYFRATVKRNCAFQQYHAMRDACIIVQAWWRGCLVRKKIFYENEAATTIQRIFKASRVRKHYIALKQAVIIIQRRWRKLWLQRRIKAEFKREWMASVTIQRFYKRYLVVKEIKKLYPNCGLTPNSSYCFLQNYYYCTKAAICIQAWYRMVVCKKRYAKIHSIIELQKFAQQCMEKKTAQRLLLHQHQSASIIQAWYRGQCQRHHYLQIRKKIVVLQSWYRGYRERTKYLKYRTSIVYLQRKWRAYLIKQKESELFERSVAAALSIQKWYRGYKIRKEYHKARLQLVLQASVRCVLIVRQSFQSEENLTNNFLSCQYQNCLILKDLQCTEAKQHMHLHRFIAALFYHTNAIRIQRCYRCYCARKLAKQQISAVLSIQHWIRAKLVRIWYTKLSYNIVPFQRASRRYLCVRHKAATKIQASVKTWLVKRWISKCHNSAIIIQAAWRGYKQRCAYSGKIITGVRSRLRKATALATEDMKLGRRASSSLYHLLGQHSLTHLLSTLTELDVVTRLSATCCQQMAEGKALDILIHIVRNCNRSVPHMELIKHSINILLNLAKYKKTVNAVWKTEGLLNTVLELMKIYREKGSDIFVKVCTLVWIFCQDPRKAKVIKENKVVREKLNSFHYLAMRKESLTKRQQLAKPQLSVSFASTPNRTYVLSRPPTFPIIEPDWVLCRNGLREFDNSLSAISAIVTFLGLKEKNLKQSRNMSIQV